jgi:hypothetical protein
MTEHAGLHESGVVTLRRARLPDGRTVMIDAGPTGGGSWEAWAVCIPGGAGPKSATAPMSPTLKHAQDVERLRNWAGAMSVGRLAELVHWYFDLAER